MKFNSFLSQSKEAAAYFLEFKKKVILFIDKFPFYTLDYFQNRHHLVNRDRIPNQNLLNSPLKFDLQFLDKYNLKTVDYIVVSELQVIMHQQDVYILPYLMRIKNWVPQIITTRPIKQCLTSFIEEFYSKSKMYESLTYFQNYFQASQKESNFEHNNGVDISNWIEIFNIADMEKVSEQIIGLNYGQIFQDQAISLIPFSSGYSLGSALWKIIQKQSDEKFLFVLNASVYNLKHCKEMQKQRIANQNVNLIMSESCISNRKETGVVIAKQFLNKLQRLVSVDKKSVIVCMQQSSFILDMVDYLNYKLKDYVTVIYVLGATMYSLLSYANTYAEYLNKILLKKIYSEKPENPLHLKKAHILQSFTHINAQKHQKNIQFLLKKCDPSVFFVFEKHPTFGSVEQIFNTFTKINGQKSIVKLRLKKQKAKDKQDVSYDLRMNIQQFIKFYKEIKPKRSVVPNWMKEIGLQGDNIYYKEGKEVEILYGCKFKQRISSQFVSNIFSKQIGSISVSSRLLINFNQMHNYKILNKPLNLYLYNSDTWMLQTRIIMGKLQKIFEQEGFGVTHRELGQNFGKIEFKHSTGKDLILILSKGQANVQSNDGELLVRANKQLKSMLNLITIN